MAEWSVDKTREWVLQTLYEKYEEDAQASIKWSVVSAVEATETHPHGDDIIRECRQLAKAGWVDILTEAYGNLFAQVTPTGRAAWEAFLKEKSANPSAALDLE